MVLGLCAVDTPKHVEEMCRALRDNGQVCTRMGAYKPRMLRLIGQKADGWLPSLGSMKPDEFQAGNAIIDTAAREAGRDPREIRRLVNISGQFSASHAGFLDGPSQQWVDELLPLVVDDGVGTFILMSDDPRTIEQFALEVAPALREAVRREHPETIAGATLRRTAVRAKRRAGIAYDQVPASLAAAAIEPGDFGYARVKSTSIRGGSPGLVLPVENTAEVADALAFARSHPDLPLGIRSGGHGFSGRSTNNGGIVIDLSRLNTIEVIDRATRRVCLFGRSLPGFFVEQDFWTPDQLDNNPIYRDFFRPRGLGWTERAQPAREVSLDVALA